MRNRSDEKWLFFSNSMDLARHGLKLGAEQHEEL